MRVLLATFFGMLLLPNWLQLVIGIIWLAALIASVYDEQYAVAALMAIGAILFFYTRYQFSRGRGFFGRAYEIGVDGTMKFARDGQSLFQRLWAGRSKKP